MLQWWIVTLNSSPYVLFLSTFIYGSTSEFLIMKKAGRDDFERHIRLAFLVHWSLCPVHGIPCEDKYSKHHCDPVLEHTKTSATVQEHPAPQDNVPEAWDTSDANISLQDQKIKILRNFTSRCDCLCTDGLILFWLMDLPRRPWSLTLLYLVIHTSPKRKLRNLQGFNFLLAKSIGYDKNILAYKVFFFLFFCFTLPYSSISRSRGWLWPSRQEGRYACLIGELKLKYHTPPPQVDTQIVPVVVSKQLPGKIDTIHITSYCSVSELQKCSLAGQLACVRSLMCNALVWMVEFFLPYFPPNPLVFPMIDI